MMASTILARWVWQVIVAMEAALVAAFCVWASTADYFVRMPESVRHGSSVSSMIATRAVWLTLILATVNVGIAVWIRGFRAGESGREFAVLPLVGSVGLFLVACWLLLLFVVFGFAQVLTRRPATRQPLLVEHIEEDPS